MAIVKRGIKIGGSAFRTKNKTGSFELTSKSGTIYTARGYPAEFSFYVGNLVDSEGSVNKILSITSITPAPVANLVWYPTRGNFTLYVSTPGETVVATMVAEYVVITTEKLPESQYSDEVEEIYCGDKQISELWRKDDSTEEPKLLYYYGDGTQGLTYETAYTDTQKVKTYTQSGTSPKYGFSTIEDGTIYKIDFSFTMSDLAGTIVSIDNVSASPFSPMSTPTISGNTISFSINAGEPEKTVVEKVIVTYTLRTTSDSTKLAVAGKTGGLMSPLDIPEHTFEFGDQNQIGTVVAISDGALAHTPNSELAGHVTIPNTIETVGVDAFNDCPGVTTVTIGENIKSIGLAAFACCSHLSTVIWNAIDCTEAGSGYYPIFGTYPDKTSSMRDTGLNSVVIGSKVKRIPAYTFSKCTSLDDVIMKTSSASIEANAFSGCISLTEFQIQDETGNSSSGTFNIGAEAFKDCSSLLSIDLGWGIKSIGMDAFRGTYTDTKDVAIYDIYNFCKIDFANQYANPLNLAGETTLYKVDFKGERTEITSINTNDLYSSNGEVTLPALFQCCYNIKKIEINSGYDTVVKVVYTKGSTDSDEWSVSTLNTYSCAVGSYFDESVFSSSFETVKIYFASTWAAYEGDTIVATISPTGSTGTNWSTFFNDNAGCKIMRTQ